MNPVWGSLTYFVLGEGLYQAGVYPSVDRVDPLNKEPVIPGTPHSDGWSLRVPCSFCETPQGLVSVSGRWLKETSLNPYVALPQITFYDNLSSSRDLGFFVKDLLLL